MRPHSVVCRLGDRDRARIPAAPGVHQTEISFITGERRLEFGLGHALEQLAEVGLRPSEVAVDLALLAATLTAADTRINRQSESQDGWTREITLHLPVSDPALWGSLEGLLARMLNFLTGGPVGAAVPRPRRRPQAPGAGLRAPRHVPPARHLPVLGRAR